MIKKYINQNKSTLSDVHKNATLWYFTFRHQLRSSHSYHRNTTSMGKNSAQDGIKWACAKKALNYNAQDSMQNDKEIIHKWQARKQLVFLVHVYLSWNV